MYRHYYNIDIRITIAERIQFYVAKSITIESTIEKLSDTASIELPREFKKAVENDVRLSLERKNLLEYIKVGDSIVIEAGYNGELFTEFTGYISEVGAEIPIVLECEDEMFKLKKMPLINHTFKSANLKEVLQFIAPGYQVNALDMPVGKYMIERATPYKVIEDLKDKYGVRCFFKGKVLYAGLTVDFKPQVMHDFTFGKNIRESTDLKYKTKASRKRYIKAVSMQKGSANKKVTYEFGDVGESEISLHAPLNLDQQQLKEWAEKYYNSVVFDGYEGSVDGWFYPRTEVGDGANIKDPNYPTGYRDGQYFIDGVTTTINDSDGIKRQNKLSFKIKSNEEYNRPTYGHITITPRVQRKKKQSGTASSKNRKG
ncbi:hypothetical protein OK18_15230 [Chryseobacterium gallinarum]|uniref:Uncharacterized protein n=1 Tax=Chryseobacterium gallinarum TaxID=1324352 RepID=A0A0G3M3M9_CHRGL|nr:hypothetical protein [Chryseobacterium gallinarum]AKK73776.1 hypothetical protein OK18_15230 [Chryseobacterium gallinarum]